MRTSVPLALLVILVGLLLITIPASGLSFEEDARYDRQSNATFPVNGSITSSGGVNYNFTLPKPGVLIISASNSNDYPVKSGIVVDIDRADWFNSDISLSRFENEVLKLNLTGGYNVARNDHDILISTYGNFTSLNVSYKINTAHSGRIPSPKIRDVEISEKQIEGEPKAVLCATVVNPSIQHYGKVLIVHTEGTDGQYALASVPPGERDTETIVLSEPPNAPIAGEVRLYTDKPSEKNDGLDQVEFVYRPGEGTTWWNESYEPVRGPWRNDHYVYENDSVRTGADAGLFGRLARTIPVKLVLLVLLAFLAFFKFLGRYD